MGDFLSPNFLLDASSSAVSDYDNPWIWAKVLIFILILALFAFLLNYFSKKKNLNSMINRKSKLNIVDTCSLGNRQFIVVAQYESERHLLAVSTSGISHLAELSPKGTSIDDHSPEN